ncbi:MAG TPA: DUF5362 family protein [Puia sp.]|jgi:hypothetical protein
MEPTTESLFELHIDHNGSSFLKEAARWAKFMAIMGFIFCGLYVLIALFAGSLIARLGSMGGSGMPAGAGLIGGGMITVFYILIALLYFFPCLYLYNFAVKMQTALASNDQEHLNGSFKNLKSCYRFLGILMIIMLGFIVLGFLVAVIGFSAMR